jgi:hypothetical protein
LVPQDNRIKRELVWQFKAKIGLRITQKNKSSRNTERVEIPKRGSEGLRNLERWIGHVLK